MPLVTILSPCYNGEKYLVRFLESVLNQTYPNIEFIFVDDGSKDDTKQIFDEYKPKFKEKKIKVKYIYQENKGQAAAVNNGLKYVNGKYLAWPDSDDELLPTSIEKKVKFLEENIDYDVVLSQATAIDEKTGKVLYKFLLRDTDLNNRDLILDYINGENIYVCNGSYLINFKKFKEVNKGLDIIISRGGQNWQILLPMAANVKFGYIPISLYNFYLKKDSHSHSGSNDEKTVIDRQKDYENLLVDILKKMDIYDKYEKNILTNFSKIRLTIYFRFFNQEKFKKEYEFLSKEKRIKIREKVMNLVIKNKTIHDILKKIYKKSKGR